MSYEDDYCVDKQLQNHSRVIERLETHQTHEAQRIDELNIKIEKMDKKLDALLEGFNELKLQTTRDDKDLELRLKTIETQLEANEKAIIESRDKARFQVTLIGLIFTAITVIATVLPIIIRIF